MSIFHLFLLFFFFRQTTAYEIRISDWSSDVCSSDLSSGPTGGLSARALTALLLSAIFLFGLVRIAANVYSYIADREGAGLATSPTIAWMLEGSSLVAWAIVMIPCWFAVRYIRPPRVPLPATALIHALLAIPVSLGHLALMVAFRTALWWMMGIDYHFNVRSEEHTS